MIKVEISSKMIIGIPIWAGRISPVFDEACKMLIIEIEDKSIKSSKVIDFQRNSLPFRASFLKDNLVNLILCGAVSEAYMRYLSELSIEVIPWMKGSVEEVVSAYLKGALLSVDEFTMPGCRNHKRSRKRRRQNIQSHNKESKLS